MLSGIKIKKKTEENEAISINDMIKNEKLATVDDYNENLMKSARKTGDEEYEIADSLYKPHKIDLSKRTRVRTNQTCERCLESANFKSKILISVYDTFHISIPSSGFLTKGHCLIIPNSHVLSSTELESNEYEELTDIQKDISRMYREELGKNAIFIESVIDLRRCLHTYIECFPISPDMHEDAEMIIYREFSDADSEWTNNKKVITTAGKGIRNAIPKGFPYINVDFDGNGGLAHVIEDSKYFRGNFAKNIVGEILRVDPMFRNRKHNDEELRRVKAEFKKIWRNYANKELEIKTV